MTTTPPPIQGRSSLLAIVLGFASAMSVGAPVRWMEPMESSTSWQNQFLHLALAIWHVFCTYGIYFYVPAAAGGFVAGAIYRQRRRREALIVGLLYIPGSMFLDSLKEGFQSWSEMFEYVDVVGIVIICAIYGLIPVAALGGAWLCGVLRRRAEE